MKYRSIRAIAFVIRCSGAATVASELASLLGLLEALWAAMSAVIVSQERLHETRSSLAGRILGTLLGVGVTRTGTRMAVVRAAPASRAAQRRRGGDEW
jgi:hypothetical protein